LLVTSSAEMRRQSDGEAARRKSTDDGVEARRHAQRAQELRAQTAAVREELAQTRAQLTNASERLAYRSSTAGGGGGSREAAAEAALGLDVDLALKEQQSEAARSLLRKVTSDVRSLEVECAQVRTPEVSGRLCSTSTGDNAREGCPQCLFGSSKFNN